MVGSHFISMQPLNAPIIIAASLGIYLRDDISVLAALRCGPLSRIWPEGLSARRPLLGAACDWAEALEPLT